MTDENKELQDAIELNVEDADHVCDELYLDLNDRYFARWCYEVLRLGGNERSCEVVIASCLMQYAASLLRRRQDVDLEGFLLFCESQFARIRATEIEKPSRAARTP